MKPYRIKHIPTGLYYKPGEVNLSKNGKVYMTSGNILTYTDNPYVIVSTRVASKIYKETKDYIAWVSQTYDRNLMVARIPKNQFEKEEL